MVMGDMYVSSYIDLKAIQHRELWSISLFYILTKEM